MEQLLALGLHHLIHWDTRPTSYYLGNIIFIDLLFDEALTLHCVQSFLGSTDIGFGLLDLAIADGGHFLVVALALGNLRLTFHLLDIRFLVLDSRHIAFLLLPTRIHLFRLGLELG